MLTKFAVTLTILICILVNTKHLSAQEIILEPIDETPPAPTQNSTPPRPPTPPVIKSQLVLGPKATITLSNDVVDYGILNPTNPVLRYTSILLDLDSTYSLLSYEDSLLTSPEKNTFIPNTTCDSGTCNSTTPSAWSSTLTYGLGVNCSANSTTSSCTIGTPLDYFALPLLQSSNPILLGSSKSSLKITYKLNTSKTQEFGNYTNNINFILTPSL